VLVPGVNLVLHFALLALTGTGDEVLVPNPGSPSYAELARLAGATPVGYPLHAEAGFLPDADEITSLITSRTRVLVLNSPHNPTGALLPESVLTRLFEVANDRRLYVVVDEARRELTSGVSALTAATAHDRTIVMNTVSGRHAGAAVVPRHLADDMAVLMTNTNSHLSLQLQQSMLYALTAPEADAWRAETREAYAARHGLVIDELGALPDVILHVRRGAWYAFPTSGAQAWGTRSSRAGCSARPAWPWCREASSDHAVPVTCGWLSLNPRCGSPTAWRASECSSTACAERGRVTEPFAWSRTENGSAGPIRSSARDSSPSDWCGGAGHVRTSGAPARPFCCRRANMSVTPASSMAFATTGDGVTAMWAPRARQASRALSRTCTPEAPKKVTSPRANTTSGVVISGDVTHFSSSGAVRRST
jgi:hypothetical protein